MTPAPNFSSIEEAVMLLAPKVAKIQEGAIPILINKWQAFLYEGLNIEEEDQFDQTKYPFEANLLITNLIIRDFLMLSVMDYSSSSSGDAQGGVKRIVTGPTEVERFSPSAEVKEILKPGGVFELFQVQICSLASKLEIMFGECGGGEFSVIRVLRSGDYSQIHKYINLPEFQNRV